jgi:hypothetical protein
MAGGQATIDLALTSFGPIMDQQVASFVEAQVPNEVAYSRDQLAQYAGGGLDTIEDLRTRISEGVNFTDQDLVEAMSDGTRESRTDAEEALRILADGVMITEADIIDNLEPDALEQFNSVRDNAGTALGIRWILWILVLIPLFVIALIGGRGWVGRLKWAGGVAAVSALIVYGGIAVAWSFNDLAQDYVPDYGTEVSADFRADYPRLSAELESDELNNRFERALDSWQQSWRNQTVPWIVGGLIAFVAGIAISMLGTKKGTPMGGGTGYQGAKPAAASASATSIPKEWGDDEEPKDEDQPDSVVGAEEPETSDEEKKPEDGPSV